MNNSDTYYLKRCVKKALLPLRMPEPLNLCEWAEQNFYLSAESSYVEGRFNAVPWQRAIMNCISNDDIRIIDWIKSARVGATKIMLAATGYFAEHKHRNQIFYQPTDGDAEDFCKTEIDTMLRDVKCMRDVFPDIGKKSKNNTQQLKQFIGSSLRIRGGKTGGAYRRVSVDCVYYDELENFDRDVQGEGSPLMLGDKRLEGSIYPKSVRMTTPKLKLGSIIEEEFLNADCRLKFHVPCPHCNEEQILKWGGKDEAFGFKWDGFDPDTCFYMCEHCQSVIRNNDLPWMNERGVWRDEESKIWIDEHDYFRDENGGYIVTPKHVGFHIWTAYSPFVQWSQFVSEFIIAQKLVAKDGDISKLKTFINTTLGETWADIDDAEKLDAGVLHNRREHYSIRGFNKKAVALFGGFDMQDDRIEGEIRAYSGEGNNESWLVDYFILRGDPSQPELWDRLHERVLATYMREDDVELPITRICFDSGGHYTTEVYEFSKRAGINFVIPTKGASTYGEPLISYPRKRTKHGVYLTMIGTDAAKDIIYNRLRLVTDDLAESTSGFYHFPIADWCDLTYFTQLCAEVKVPKKHRGRMVMVYDAGSRRNEPIDCASGSLCALKISIEHYGLNLEALAEKIIHPERNTTIKNNFLDVAKRLNG